MSVIYNAAEILELLSKLDTQIADDLETETLDFKECPTEVKLKELAKESAICLGNVSGGTVVFGVKERVLGLDKAIVGIDFAPDLEALKATIYDSIDPKLPVQLEWLVFGSRRLLLMHVYPSMPPYTTTSGKGWIRVGKDCKPMTGSLLRQLREKVGLSDPTVLSIPVADPYKALSPAAIDILRRELKTMGAPADLLACNDADLSVKMGMVRDGKLTLGGLLVAGREEIIAVHAPNHEWKYSRMRTDTDFETPPVSGRDCILSALEKIMLLLGQQNPVTTIPSGLFHAEFPQYPVIALREALLNAFAHRDYSIPGMVFIRHYRDRFEINSPGGFIGGVKPDNILHHPPVTRNRYLVETILLATRLVNRQNLGVPRIFRALLEEAKEPPTFDEIGQTVRVTFPGQKVDQAFKALLHFLVDKQGAFLDVDDLLLLHFFRRRHEAHWNEVREAYPYDDRRLKEKLSSLEANLLVVEHSGTGRGTIYRLSRRASAILNESVTYDMTRRLDREAIKVRILSLLKDRPLRNSEIRDFTDLDRQQVYRVMKELERDDLILQIGYGQSAKWHLKQSLDKQ
jgi:ATP-dependent DNA helicase RecG